MSHELETHGAEAAFFSARVTPWHKLGIVTTEAQTAADAIRLAHLDWEVTKEPLTATVLTEDGVSTIDVPDKYATVRVNPFTGQPEALGVVGNQYLPVQNWENAEFLDAIVGESGAHFETAGSLHGGRAVFVTMKAPESLMIAGADAVDLYLVATNRHDGTGPFSIAATPTRVECKNTLRMGLRNARATFTTRHTTNARSRIDEARSALNVMWNYAHEFEAEANALAAQRVTDREFEAIVAGLFPAGKDETPRSQASRERTVGTVRHLYHDAPTQAGFGGTAWGVYNAVAEYADWFKPVRGGDVDGELRATRIADGVSDDLKARALDLLIV